MKKLTSLEDTATIAITGRDAVMLRTLLGRTKQESLAFPQESKKDLMLKELQSKMDALQCEIDKIKGETF